MELLLSNTIIEVHYWSFCDLDWITFGNEKIRIFLQDS
jgi:hypothetical protein